MKRTAAEIEAILCGEKYRSREEAIAAAQAMSEPGDEIQIHDFDCEIDEEDNGCTCEPILVVHRGELAKA